MSDPNPNLERRNGTPALRAGQSVNSGFIDSIISAYSNVTHHPVVLALFCITSVWYVSELVKSETPLTALKNQLDVIAVGKAPQIVKSVAIMLAKLATVLNTFDQLFLRVLALSSAYFSKPSTRTAVTCVLVFLFNVIANHSVFEVILFSHLVYLFVTIRSPRYKLILFFAFIAVWYFDLIHGTLLKDIVKPTVSEQFTPPQARASMGTTRKP